MVARSTFAEGACRGRTGPDERSGVISVIEGLLAGADIPYLVTDRNMSILEGSATAIQVRILVRDEHEAEARSC